MGWGNFETDDRRRSGDASLIFFLIFFVHFIFFGLCILHLLGRRNFETDNGRRSGEVQSLIFSYFFLGTSVF